jgi:hypothetical protein
MEGEERMEKDDDDGKLMDEKLKVEKNNQNNQNNLLK